MARQVSTIQVVKKLGNLVGYKGLDGKVNAMNYVPGEDRNDAKTAVQMEQRAKFKLAAQVASMLSTLGEQVNVANGLKPTRRGKLMAQLLGYITETVNGPVLASDLPLVRRPKGNMEVDPTFRTTAPGALTSGSIKFKAACTSSFGTLQRTIVCLLLYNQRTNEWRSACHAFGPDGTNEVTVFFSKNWSDSEVVCYGYALGIITDTETAPVSSIGNLEGTESEMSITVDTTGVAYGNLLFTQVYSITAVETVPALS